MHYNGFIFSSNFQKMIIIREREAKDKEEEDHDNDNSDEGDDS